jgi:hypothetical protein
MKVSSDMLDFFGVDDQTGRFEPCFESRDLTESPEEWEDIVYFGEKSSNQPVEAPLRYL